MHLTHRCWAFLAIIAVPLLAACGPPPASPTTTPAAPAPPHIYTQPQLVNTPGWNAYQKKCEHLNQNFQPANVVYHPTERMRRGTSKAIEAAVTLRIELPPQEVLETSEAVARRLLVSCVIEAELRAAEAEFDIQPQGWRSESLLTSSTAYWTWFVTPKQGGTHELILAFRPVITVEDQTEKSSLSSYPPASTQPYRITVDVSVPPDQWVADKLDRTTALIKSATGTTVALTALVAAIIALLAIRQRRARSKSPSNNSTPD